jgi:LCP family protein required for cell wall assembly
MGRKERDGSYEDGRTTGQGGYYEDRRNDQGGYYEERRQDEYQGEGRRNNQGGYYGGGRGYDTDGPDPASEKKKKKKKRRKWIFVLEFLVLLILAVGIGGAVLMMRMDHVSLKEIVVNSGISKTGYRNIALFGVDSRSGELESGTNSDTIMICSINNKTGEIKLVSVYRDTYLDLSNGTYSKANASYAIGGAEQAISMLNKNLDLDITDFVTVNFESIIKMVDKIGGIEMDITEEERGWLNGYLVETSEVTGESYTTLEEAGYQTLTGIQAMAFCRIRYTTGWDYKRTERQREVLTKIFQKAQSQGVATLLSIANDMLPYISTSLSTTDILSLVAGLGKYSIGETAGFPFEKQAADISAGDVVVPVNLAQNVTELHEYLFDETGYTPSSTVQEISDRIISETGIQ